MNTFPLFEVPQQIRSNFHLYFDHPDLGKHAYGSGTGPLSHGRTFYFKDVAPLTPIPFRVHTKNSDLILELWLASALAGDIVKFFYHQLEPGQCIDPHADQVPYFSLTRRYQIMMDVPEGFVCKQLKSRLAPWHVHRFNANQPHSYENNSDVPVGFFVVDLVEPLNKEKFMPA